MNITKKTQSENSSYTILILKNKVGSQMDMCRKEVATKKKADSFVMKMCKNIEKELPDEKTIPSFTRIQTVEITVEQYLYIKQKKIFAVMETKYFDYYYSHLDEYSKDI